MPRWTPNGHFARGVHRLGPGRTRPICLVTDVNCRDSAPWTLAGRSQRRGERLPQLCGDEGHGFLRVRHDSSHSKEFVGRTPRSTWQLVRTCRACRLPPSSRPISIPCAAESRMATSFAAEGDKEKLRGGPPLRSAMNGDARGVLHFDTQKERRVTPGSSAPARRFELNSTLVGIREGFVDILSSQRCGP